MGKTVSHMHPAASDEHSSETPGMYPVHQSGRIWRAGLASDPMHRLACVQDFRQLQIRSPYIYADKLSRQPSTSCRSRTAFHRLVSLAVDKAPRRAEMCKLIRFLDSHPALGNPASTGMARADRKVS